MDDRETFQMVSRSNGLDQGSTVFLLYLREKDHQGLYDLGCVQDIMPMPSILKLMPLARSISSSDASTVSPPLKIQLSDNAPKDQILDSINLQLSKSCGFRNGFVSELGESKLILGSMSNFECWRSSVDSILLNPYVEWVDTTNILSVSSTIALSSNSATDITQDTAVNSINAIADLMGVTDFQQHGM